MSVLEKIKQGNAPNTVKQKRIMTALIHNWHALLYWCPISTKSHPCTGPEDSRSLRLPDFKTIGT
jgi:hypothetical protein